MSTPRPSLPIPTPLRGAEAGTFAHDTVVRRMPGIAARVAAENDFPPEIAAALDELVREMPHGTLRPLRDTHAPDAELWAGYLAPYLGQTWLEAPWFVAETYMFRRILEATGFFGDGPGAGVDPYALQKRRGLELARDDGPLPSAGGSQATTIAGGTPTSAGGHSFTVSANAAAVSANSAAASANSAAASANSAAVSANSAAVSANSAAVSANSAAVSANSAAVSANSAAVSANSATVSAVSSSAGALAALIHGSLWGNQADLSLWPAEQGGRPLGDSAPRAERLLADDTPALAAHIIGLARGGRVDVVLDNGGHELLSDLALVEALLELDITVVLHAKPHPTYVSDVTMPDLDTTLAWLLEQPGTAPRGSRLVAAREAGQLRARADWFWTSPLAAWDMPGALRAELAGSGLIISKGDANYRRWLGDRHWAFDAPLDAVLAYAPAPLALLRTCKSDVAAGLAPERIATAAAQDAEWIYAGRWGVVQFVQR